MRRYVMTLVGMLVLAGVVSAQEQKPEQAPVQKDAAPVQAPVQKDAAPVQAPTQKLAPVQAPTQKAVQAPTQKAVQGPVQSPVQKGAEPVKTARVGLFGGRYR
jgi:hypothetical protein